MGPLENKGRSNGAPLHPPVRYPVYMNTVDLDNLVYIAREYETQKGHFLDLNETLSYLLQATADNIARGVSFGVPCRGK